MKDHIQEYWCNITRRLSKGKVRKKIINDPGNNKAEMKNSSNQK
jgi:hypothetical protein